MKKQHYLNTKGFLLLIALALSPLFIAPTLAQSTDGTESIEIQGVEVITPAMIDDIFPCTELLQQLISLDNKNSVGQTNFVFGVDVTNEGINLTNLPSGWNYTKNGTIYEFVIDTIPPGLSEDLELNFKLDCDITTDGLEHKLVSVDGDVSSAPISYNAQTTFIGYEESTSQFPGVLGQDIDLTSVVSITNGATKSLRFDFKPEEEFNIESIKVNISQGDITSSEYTFEDINQEFSSDSTLLHNYLTVDLTFLPDSVWTKGDENLIVTTSYSLTVCSAPQQDFSFSFVQNLCDSVECGPEGNAQYDAFAVAANTQFETKMDLISSGDACDSTSLGSLAVIFTNPSLEGTPHLTGTGGKTLTNFGLTMSTDFIAFDEVLIQKQTASGSTYSFPIITYIENANAPLDTSNFNNLYRDQIDIRVIGGVLGITFDFLTGEQTDMGIGTPDDLSGTPWENIFTTLYEIDGDSTSGLHNAIAESDSFQIVFTGLRFIGDDLTKTCGEKNGGNPNFLSLVPQHTYRDMCGNIISPRRFVSNGFQTLGIHGHHPNDNSIYWDGALKMDGLVLDTNGVPLEGVDLTENSKVQLTLEVIEKTLQFPTAGVDADSTYGATEYNPWDMNLDVFGTDTLIEYWSVVTLPNGLEINDLSTNNISFNYLIFDEETQSLKDKDENGNPLTHVVTAEEQIQFGLVDVNNTPQDSTDDRSQFAFRSDIPGVDMNTVTDVTLPLALNCDSFNASSCSITVAPELPDGDVNLEIRAYRCAPQVVADTQQNQINFRDSRYLTTACGTFEFLVHCNGLCGSPIGATDGFVMERSTLGWTDEPGAPRVKIDSFDTAGAVYTPQGEVIDGLSKDDLELSHVYPLDEVYVEMTGVMQATYNPCGGGCEGTAGCEVQPFFGPEDSTIFEFLPIIQYRKDGAPAGLFSMAQEPSIIKLRQTNGETVIIDVPVGEEHVKIVALEGDEDHLNRFEFSPEINLQIASAILNKGSFDDVQFITKIQVNRVGNEGEAYPLRLLSQNFTANVGGVEFISCDPWTTDLTYFNPELTDIHLQVSNNQSHASGELMILSQSITPVQNDDFENEFRPWLQWPEEITFELTNVTFDGMTQRDISSTIPQDGYSFGFSSERPTQIIQTDGTTPGTKELTFKLDVEPGTPFFWNGIERGTQNLSFFVRKTTNEGLATVNLAGHPTSQKSLSSTFFYGPEVDNRAPSLYSRSYTTFGHPSSGTPLSHVDAPVVITLLNPTFPIQPGNSNPVCYEINLKNEDHFLENVWIEIDNPDSLIDRIEIERVPLTILNSGKKVYGDINDLMTNLNRKPVGEDSIEYYEMYKDANNNFIGYLGTINQLKLHATSSSSPQIANSGSNYKICFYFNCADENGELNTINPTIRVGWDSGISNDEIFNQNFLMVPNAETNINLGSSDVNEVITYIDSVSSYPDLAQTIDKRRANSSFTGRYSADVDLQIEPQNSILALDDRTPIDGIINIDRSEGINEKLEFGLRSVGQAEVTDVVVKIAMPSGLLNNFSVEEIINFDSSTLNTGSLQDSSLAVLASNNDVFVMAVADTFLLSFKEGFILTPGVGGVGNPNSEIDFKIEFGCLPVNFEGDIDVNVTGKNVCDIEISPDNPLSVDFQNIYPEVPTFNDIDVVAIDGTAIDNCPEGKLEFQIDLGTALSQLLMNDGTFSFDDVDMESLEVTSANALYTINRSNISYNEDSTIISILVDHHADFSRSCEFLSGIFEYSVEVSKTFTEDCSITSTISGGIGLCPLNQISCVDACSNTVAADNLSDAMLLCDGADICEREFTNVGATSSAIDLEQYSLKSNDGQTILPSDLNLNNDVWFKLEVPGSHVKVSLAQGVSTRGIRYPKLYLWEKVDNELTLVATNEFTAAIYHPVVSFNNLDPSTEVEHFISVDKTIAPASYSGSFKLCVEFTATNDFFDHAELITSFGEDYTIDCSGPANANIHDLAQSAYSSRDATANDVSFNAPGLNDPDKISIAIGPELTNKGVTAYNPVRDVWFKLDLSTSSVTVKLDPVFNNNHFLRYAKIYLWEKTGNVLTMKATNFYSFWNNTPVVSANDLDTDAEHFISVDQIRDLYTDAGTFTLCIEETASNDFLSGAEELPAPGADGPICVGTLTPTLEEVMDGPYSNRSATGFDKDVNVTDDIYSPNRDVWFKLDVPANGINVQLTRSNDNNIGIRYAQLYLWEQIGQELNLLDSDISNAWNGTPEVSISAPSTNPEVKYFISVDFIKWTPEIINWTGAFQLCLSTNTSNTSTSSINNETEINFDSFDGEDVLNSPDITKQNISVFPNPSDGNFTFTIELVEDAEVQLSIYSLEGQLVETLVSEEMNQGFRQVEFNGSRLNNGFYYYRAYINGEVVTGKLSINK